jgi:hypothetical protein
MSRVNPQTYHLLKMELATAVGDGVLTLPQSLADRLRPGDGILIGTWHEESLIGNVSALVVVKSLDIRQNQANVDYVETSLTLKPNPSGRRWWRNAHFKFAESVRERYMLDDIFAEHFPGYADIDIMPLRRPSSSREKNYLPIAGSIYVLQSVYGYKIGKTVSLKDRIRLFGVKLPFQFELVVTGLVENYSKVEAELHRRYSHKRLEGEWFDLAPEDVDEIEAYLRANGQIGSTCVLE